MSVVGKARDEVLKIVLEHGFTEEAVRQVKSLGYFFYLNTNGHHKFLDRRYARIFTSHLMRVVSGSERRAEFMKLEPHIYLEHFYNLSNHPEVTTKSLRAWLEDQFGTGSQFGLEGTSREFSSKIQALLEQPKS